MEKQLPLIQNIDEQARNLDNNIGKLFSTTNNSSAPIINTKNPTNDIVVERGFITSAISLLTISQYERDYLIIDGYLNTAFTSVHENYLTHPIAYNL